MASEHETGISYAMLWRKVFRLEGEKAELEQQLAQARDLLRKLYWTAVEYDENGLAHCQLCESRQASHQDIPHDAQCMIGELRAFLAKPQT